jgi:hypothetical protein
MVSLVGEHGTFWDVFGLALEGFFRNFIVGILHACPSKAICLVTIAEYFILL